MGIHLKRTHQSRLDHHGKCYITSYVAPIGLGQGVWDAGSRTTGWS